MCIFTLYLLCEGSSSRSLRFGQPIKLDDYKEQFFSGVEGGPRAAVKRLTAQIEKELVEATINAPDWYVICLIVWWMAVNFSGLRDTLYSARMARDLLWEKDKSIKLDEFVTISQTYR